MSRSLVLLVTTVLASACFVGAASAKVGPSAAGTGQTQITPPKASTFVTLNILPRLLVTSLTTR